MEKITVSILVNAPLSKVWEYWNSPEHISSWAFATPEWGAEAVENQLTIGGHFKTHMFERNGGASFDFEGIYTVVEPEKQLAYSMSDGRTVSILFEEVENGVRITESFDPEREHTEELQRAGWQGFLNSFKRYVEN